MAVTLVRLPGKERPCARQQRRANRTGQFVPVLWLAAALLGSAGVARLHFGVSEPLHGQALVVSLQKTRAAVERAKPAARAAQSRKTKSPLPPLRPQKSLMKLVNRKLKRRATFNDTLFEVLKQDEKKGYLVRATLVFLPGCPSKTGGWAQDLKEAEDSAAGAILKDPFLSAALDKPVQNLHNLVSKFHRRPPSADDVKYTVREESVADGQEAQYVASVHLSTFPGNLSLEGRPRVNETKARWSAAEAMLLNPEFQAIISKPEKPAWERLHEMMTTKVRSLGRAMTSEDIVYTMEEREDMPAEARFRAKLRLQYLPMAEVAGRAQRSKVLAKEAAASAFLSDPVAELLLSPDPVTALRDQVNRRLRMKTSPDDIVYTVTQEPLKKGRFSFQASVALPCLKDDSEEEIKIDGAAAATKVEARMKAAEALLLDPKAQQLLFPLAVRSRVLRACNAAEVLKTAVAQVEH